MYIIIIRLVYTRQGVYTIRQPLYAHLTRLRWYSHIIFQDRNERINYNLLVRKRIAVPSCNL